MLFTIVSTLIFSLLTVMWRSDDSVNLLIKFALAGITAWGIFLIATDL